MHELPLLIFTLCLQGSVGVTLWLALGCQYAVEGRVPARVALPAMAGAFVLACVGLLTSALHMGYPLNALNALRHVASSWLSREIVFASLYLAVLGLGVVLLFFRSQAGSRCWRWRQRSGWWMYSAWRRFISMPRWRPGSIATRWRCFLARQALSFGSHCAGLSAQRWHRNALRCGGGRTDGADSPDHAAAMAGGY